MKRLLVITLLFTGAIHGQDLLAISLKDGGLVVGHIQAANETQFFILDLQGAIHTVDKAAIESIKKGATDVTARLMPPVDRITAPPVQYRRVATIEESMALIAKSFETIVIIQVFSIMASIVIILVAI